ncbi:hypothetical protein CTAM01_04192 [Colletotrichum tamarilloi]|uniref:Uncharacterized protein n=1 Tax=Colletotrichum tamarilloi TaxID=1209934 RepID=A0ABQ9RI02_9PEZI|nr:uncharacterized protein CTAM01_04192 [Colletotrichum tamarilloi]KAK1503962.1 hypothetical protein CTAM01_04192 [Colletotrichum tamarilloi]
MGQFGASQQEKSAIPPYPQPKPAPGQGLSHQTEGSMCYSESHGQSWRKGKLLSSVWYGLGQLSAFLPSSTASCNALCDKCSPSHN